MNMNFTLEGFMEVFNLNNRNPEDEEKISGICNITSQIASIYLWILFAVGFPGNVLTIITTLTMQVMSPATFFVALLAAFDGSALLAKLIYNQVVLHKVPMNDFGCKVENITTYLATVANWMLVLICAERFVSVCYPLQKITLITKRRSYIVAAVVSGFILIVYGAISIPMRGLVLGACTTKQTYYDFWINYWFWINAAFFLFIPFFLIVIFTVGIIRGLQVSRRNRRSLHEKGSARQTETETGTGSRKKGRLAVESERIERSITVMMILAAALFIALSLPACVYHLIERNSSAATCSESLSRARWDIFKQIQHVLVDATHAINFFIYFFTAKRFRKQLFRLLACKVCKKKTFNNKHQHTYSTQLSTSSKINLSIVPRTSLK